MIGPILRRAEAGRLPSRREVLLMLRTEGNEYLSLLETAGRVCRQHKGDKPLRRGVVLLSEGFDLDQAVNGAVRAWRHGYHSVVLHSRSSLELVEEVAALIGAIKEQTGLTIALCMNERPYDVYAAWRQAGADEYLLPHECCNPERYAQIHPGHSPATRLARYLWLNGLGYRVTGGIRIGMQGEAVEELADDLEVMRNANLTGVMLYPMQEEADVLRVAAIARLCLPEADIGLVADDPLLQARALAYGANLVTTAEFARAEMATAH